MNSSLRNRLIGSLVAGLLILFSVGNVGWAAIVASDSFNYTSGALNGQDGGTGWSGAWGAVDSTAVVDPNPNLAFGGIDGGDGAIRFSTPANNNAAYRSLASAFSGDEVYLSFLFRFDTGTITDNDFMGFWVDNVTTGTHTNVPNIGLKAEQGTSDRDYFIRLTGTGGTYSAHQAVLGETVQIVGRLSKEGGSAVFNRYQLWVNPDYDDLLSPDVTISGSSSLSSFDKIGFRTANLGTNDTLLVDELRVATAWGNVVVPEPASLAIWSLIAAGAAGAASRRKARRGRWSNEQRVAIRSIVERTN